MAYIRDVTEHFAVNVDKHGYALMLQVAGQLETDSSKADALTAIAGVLPDEAGLKEAYRRTAQTIEDETLQREVLDALNTNEGFVPELEAAHKALAEAMNRAKLSFPPSDALQADRQNPNLQPLYDEARAYCTDEKFAERIASGVPYPYTMLTVQPVADTEFLIEPGYDALVQRCVERFLTDAGFRERLKNPPENDFLLGH